MGVLCGPLIQNIGFSKEFHTTFCYVYLFHSIQWGYVYMLQYGVRQRRQSSSSLLLCKSKYNHKMYFNF